MGLYFDETIEYTRLSEILSFDFDKDVQCVDYGGIFPLVDKEIAGDCISLAMKAYSQVIICHVNTLHRIGEFVDGLLNRYGNNLVIFPAGGCSTSYHSRMLWESLQDCLEAKSLKLESGEVDFAVPTGNFRRLTVNSESSVRVEQLNRSLNIVGIQEYFF